MNQASNHLTEAAEGEYGKEIAEDIQERIDWVAGEVEGDRILDVGCNQGKLSIMLGKQGKKVIGIDSDEKVINYARQSLEEESEEVKQNVSFQKVDILEDTFEEEKFDTIILSEVLEQYKSAEPVLEAVSRLMKGNGKIIVTVPFGIRDYNDQKRVFYFHDIYQEVKQLFKVEEVKFIGNSVGLTGTVSLNKNRGPIPVRFIQRLEEAFYQLEQRLREENTDNKQVTGERKMEKGEDNKQHSNSEAKSDSSKQKEKELEEANQTLRDQLKKSQELNQQWEEKIKQLHEENTSINQKWTARFQELKKQTEDLITRYKKQIEKLKKNKK